MFVQEKVEKKCITLSKYWVSPRAEIISIPSGQSHRDLCPVKSELGVKQQMKSGWIRIFDDSMQMADSMEQSAAFMTGFCLLKQAWEFRGRPKGADVYVKYLSGRQQIIDFNRYQCD